MWVITPLFVCAYSTVSGFGPVESRSLQLLGSFLGVIIVIWAVVCRPEVVLGFMLQGRWCVGLGVANLGSLHVPDFGIVQFRVWSVVFVGVGSVVLLEGSSSFQGYE